MSSAKRVKAILEATEKYERFLETLSEEEFSRSPAPGVWSYAEVFSHIFQANIGSLISIERCVHGNKAVPGKASFIGRLILFFGFFPNMRFKAPAQIASLAVKTSKEEARNYIIKFKNKLAEIASQVQKAPKINTVKHPRLGMLNAAQWLRFIQIHTAHHYNQLGRIQKML